MPQTREPEPSDPAHIAPTDAASPDPAPQLELDFSPRPEPPPPEPPPSEPDVVRQALLGTSDLNSLIDPIARLLSQVVAETVRQSVDAAVGQLQRLHARDRDEFAQRIEAALERQGSHLRDLLEQQDTRLQTTLAHQAKQHSEDMRVLVHDVRTQPPATPPAIDTQTTEVIGELQETLRLGFGEVRGSLDRHHHELMNLVRAELRPLAQAALTHLNRPTPAPALQAPAPREPVAAPAPASSEPSPTPPARASPTRPRHDDHASSQRRHAAIQEYDDADAIEDPDDHHRRPHSRMPDDTDHDVSQARA